jgi:hypothetical protein
MSCCGKDLLGGEIVDDRLYGRLSHTRANTRIVDEGTDVILVKMGKYPCLYHGLSVGSPLTEMVVYLGLMSIVPAVGNDKVTV